MCWPCYDHASKLRALVCSVVPVFSKKYWKSTLFTGQSSPQSRHNHGTSNFAISKDSSDPHINPSPNSPWNACLLTPANSAKSFSRSSSFTDDEQRHPNTTGDSFGCRNFPISMRHHRNVAIYQRSNISRSNWRRKHCYMSQVPNNHTFIDSSSWASSQEGISTKPFELDSIGIWIRILCNNHRHNSHYGGVFQNTSTMQ